MGAQPEGAVAWTSAASAAEARRRPQRPREVGGMLLLLGCMWGERGERARGWRTGVGFEEWGVGHELTGGGGAVCEPEGR